ncbi:MAG: hypothetical protein K8H88_03135, partial [Sandaracinaceae bacterium]|nr:hypothetical protein [Sandaracinaceae bacterium]
HYAGRTSATLAAGRLIGLAVTDTVTRALDVFETLAAEHGVWIAVTTNVADARRVTDPALIDALADEAETDRSFAWEAIGDDLHNQTLVYGPDGGLQHRFRKAYLVPIEEAEDGLALSFGPLDALRPLQLPFARIASVISKDAWMPDVLDRLALEDTQVLLQPEAFSGWGIAHGADAAWAPDVVKESGWAQLARDPELDASVLPCLSQNLFELVFDCQSSVLASTRQGSFRDAWIGQDDDAFFGAVGPWSFDEGTGTLDERRARLMTQGARLLPGGDLEDQYSAETVTFDLDPTNGFPIASAGTSERALAPSDAGEERRPAIVATEEGFAVFFEDDRAGRARIYGVLGSVVENELSFGAARVRVATEGEVRAIRAAARGEQVCLTWQEDRRGWSARLACSRDGGRSFETPIEVGGGATEWVPDVAIDEDGTVWLAQIDPREPHG